LRKECPHLRELGEWYKENANKLGIETRAYYEMAPTGPVRVVEPSSANPMVEGCNPVAVDGHHFSICKPASPGSAVYLGVKSFLADRTAGLFVSAAQPAVFEEAKVVETLNDWPADPKAGKGRMERVKDIIHPIEIKCKAGEFPVNEEQLMRGAFSKRDLDRIILYVWERFNNRISENDPLIHIRHEFQRMAAQRVDFRERTPSTIPLYYAVESYEELTKGQRLSPSLRSDLQYMHNYIERRAPAIDEGEQVRMKLRSLMARCS
jgi:hypothetical protein